MSDAPFAGKVQCGFCGREAQGVYFQVGDTVSCTRCKNEREAGPQGSRIGRFSKALAFGLFAGAIGAALWYGVRRLTGYEIGLIAIVVGFLVGAAVRFGSGGRGGWRYQVLAVGLTYFSICLNYAPDVVSGLLNQAEQGEAGEAAPDGENPASAPVPSPIAPAPEVTAGEEARPGGIAGGVAALVLFVMLVLAISLAAPFLGGLENALGLLIIGFGLWQAWKMNAATPIEISGPFRIGATPAAEPPPPPAPIHPE
ncbi:MAG: hypothetical protein NDJ94_16705 [Vicinamibacteria bacterium]|nr:hypothetical protein [Vicinamibacteria bacterium]